MPRIARVVMSGIPHHGTHRGNNRQDVFFVDDDRRAYLDTLGEQCRRFSVALHGYRQKPNHVHLVLTPRTADGLARAVGRVYVRHSHYINRLHGRSVAASKFLTKRRPEIPVELRAKTNVCRT